MLFMPKRLHLLYPFSSLLIGLFLAQILATLQVYLSNTHLYDSLLAIKDAGYLPVPNRYIMDQLHNFAPAFCAGLFFTFSIGAGISFFSLGLAWIWDRLFFRKKYLLYLILLLWALCLFLINLHGFNLLATLYFLVIPPIVFAFVIRSLTYLSQQNRHHKEIIHIIPVMVLALLLAWQLDNRMFTDFRDIFLLSNPIGSRINNFYYKYTLYAAEVFKSLDQKMLKTCKIENMEKNAPTLSIEKILADYDYLPVEGRAEVDLKILTSDGDFIFKNKGKTIFQITSKAFLADPARVIKKFSKKSDRFALFRQIVFLSLLIGFPLAIYVLGHGLIAVVLSFFFHTRKSSAIATALCFSLSLILFFSFHFNRSRDFSLQSLAEALMSDRWQARVAALKTIDEKGLEITQFQAYPKLLASTHIAERYWFVRALANSRSPSTYRDLLNFLDDPHPNVSTMAFYALGKRGNKQAIAKIIAKIETVKDWYRQWYAYNALKSLDWRQVKLN
jgi:HEAT repeats